MVGAIIVSALYGCGLCGCGGSAGPSVPSTPPVAIEGLDGGTDVEIDSSFKYTFSKDVDSDTVSATTFFIVEAPSAEASVSLSPKISPKAAYDSNVCDVDQALAGTVSCSSATECILTPDSDLAANTTYGICLLPGTTAADGETLVGIWYDDGTAFE